MNRVTGCKYDKSTWVSEYLSGGSTRTIANKHGVGISTVRRHLLKHGVLRSILDGLHVAATNGRLGSGFRGKHRTLTEDHKANIKKSSIMRGERLAKGVSVKPSGYLEFTRGENKFKLVHRVEVEKNLGRKLTAKEVVHHIDGDKKNNEIDNLLVLTAAEHSKLHAIENYTRRKRNKYGRFK